MTPEIQQQLIDWLKSLGNLAADELPAFVQEVAQYGFYSSITVIFCVSLFILVSLGALYLILKEAKKTKQSNETIGFILIYYLLFLSIPLGVIILNCKEAIKAKCAPRLYVIERLTK